MIAEQYLARCGYLLADLDIWNKKEKGCACWSGKETKGEERISKEEVHWEQGSCESKG